MWKKLLRIVVTIKLQSNGEIQMAAKKNALPITFFIVISSIYWDMIFVISLELGGDPD